MPTDQAQTAIEYILEEVDLSASISDASTSQRGSPATKGVAQPVVRSQGVAQQGVAQHVVRRHKSILATCMTLGTGSDSSDIKSRCNPDAKQGIVQSHGRQLARALTLTRLQFRLQI